MQPIAFPRFSVCSADLSLLTCKERKGFNFALTHAFHLPSLGFILGLPCLNIIVFFEPKQLIPICFYFLPELIIIITMNILGWGQIPKKIAI